MTEKSFTTENLKALERNARVYADVKKSLREGSNYQLSRGEKGEHLLLEGRLIDSGDPAFFSDTVKDLFTGAPKRILLVEGFGLGYLVEYLLKKAPPEVRQIIAIEPDPARFAFALENRDLVAVLKDPRFSLVLTDSTTKAFVEFINILRVPDIAFGMNSDYFCPHPVISSLNRDFFEVARDEWKAAKIQIRSHFGTKQDSVLGFEVVMKNRSMIEKTPGINNLKGAFAGVPAIIASTGPSLEKSLDKLKELQDRALIFSPDASLSILLKAGITPHFVCAIERDTYCKKFFEESCRDQHPLKTNLVFFPFIPQEGLDAFTGPKWVAYRDYGYLQMFEGSQPKGILSSSSSVSHMCLRLASYLGCGPIVLVGQDLALDPKDFNSHCRGIVYKEWEQPRSFEAAEAEVRALGFGDLFWVPGNLQDKVPTYSVYFHFAKEFSWEASHLSVPLINSTEGGARLPGMAYRRLQDSSAGWGVQNSLFENIARLRKAPSGNLDDLTYIRDYLKEFSPKMKLLQGLMADFSAATLPEPARMETCKVIRTAQCEIFKDGRFICFIVQNAGREFLDIENEINSLPENDPKVLGQRFAAMRRWTDHVLSVMDSVLESMDKYAHLPAEKRTIVNLHS